MDIEEGDIGEDYFDKVFASNIQEFHRKTDKMLHSILPGELLNPRNFEDSDWEIKSIDETFTDNDIAHRYQLINPKGNVVGESIFEIKNGMKVGEYQ